MKAAALALLIADDEHALIDQLLKALAQHEGTQPRRHHELPIVRIGKVALVLLPARGTAAPAPETGKPISAKQIPWCPERVVWLACDEMRKTQLKNADRRGFTQTVKMEIITFLANSEKVVVLRTRSSGHCADDLLVFDMEERRAVRQARISTDLTGAQMLSAIEEGGPYQPSRASVERTRFRSKLDYIVATNLDVGISAKLKAAKAGPLRGVRLTFLQLGLLAAFADTRSASGAVRWEGELVIQRGHSEFLAATLDPPAPPDSRYDALVGERPRTNAQATVARVERRSVRLAPPPALTYGDLLDVALASGDECLSHLSEAIRFLVRRQVITDSARSAGHSLDEFLAVSEALAEGGFGTPNVLALVDCLRVRGTAIESFSAGWVPTKEIDGALLGGLDLTPFYHRLVASVVDRWAQGLLGPVQCDEVSILFACAGKTYRTTRYDRISDRGWAGDELPLAPSPLIEGERWTVVEAGIEAITDALQIGSGRRFDLLTREQITDDPWSELRIPKATLAYPSSALDALCRLVDGGYLEARAGRLSLSALGRQVLLCVPELARHPMWILNVRSAARRADSPALRQALEGDLFAMLRAYRGALEKAPIIVSKTAWTKDASKEPTGGAAAGRGDDRLIAERPSHEAGRAS